jgi:hypothetical protein
MEEKLVDKISLDNGLTLEIFDRSRPMAGDRWLVHFVARIEVAVKAEYFDGREGSDVSFEAVRRAVGDRTAYSHEKKSNFIDEREKDNVFKALMDGFLDANLRYLSTPDFASKLILKKYREAQGTSVNWKPQ